MKETMNKHCFRIRWIIVLLIMPFVLPLNAQDSDTTDTPTPSVSNIHVDEGGVASFDELQLPPLFLLLENAKHSSSIKYFKTLKKQEESAMTSVNRDWTKYFRMDGSYRYGKNSLQSTTDDSVITQKGDKFQSWYSAGVSVSIPFEDILDRGQRKKRQQLRIQAIEDQMESTYTELKVAIVELYTQAQKELELLKMRIEEMTLSETRYKDAEAEFLNGKITMQELTDQKNLQIASVQNYIESKYNLNNVLLKLELLTNTQIFNDAQSTQTLE